MAVSFFILRQMIGMMGIALLNPSYGNRRYVDVGGQFIAPVGTPVHSEGAMNRAPTLQIANGKNNCAGPVDFRCLGTFASWRISCSNQRMY